MTIFRSNFRTLKTSSIFILLLAFLFSFQLNAQVGINTTNPTATLDVNGNLRIRQLDEGSGSHVLSINGQGKVSKFKTFLLYDANEVVAQSPVQEMLSGSETVDDIDLGLKVVVTIPSQTAAKVIINYSVPMGTSLNNSPDKTYIGLRFLKDYVEMAQGSRKFTLPPLVNRSNNNISSMGTISCTYIENFVAYPTERVFVYAIEGYIEQHVAGNQQHIYKFNMWDNGQNNYNWGKGSISYQTYVK